MAHHYHEDSDPTHVGTCRLCKQALWSNDVIACFEHLKEGEALVRQAQARAERIMSDEMIERLVAVATEAYQGAYLDGIDRRPDLRKGFRAALHEKLEDGP